MAFTTYSKLLNLYICKKYTMRSFLLTTILCSVLIGAALMVLYATVNQITNAEPMITIRKFKRRIIL